jgi:PAS domain S-box-containing protein
LASIPDVRWILDGLPVGIWVGGLPDGRAVYTNPEFENILGVHAVPGSTIDDAPVTYGVVDAEGHPYPTDRLPFSRVVATGESVVVDDMAIHRPDGRRSSIRAFGYPLRGESSALTHVVVAFVDISAEIRAKVERRQSQQRLAIAVEHAPIAIWATDRLGVVTLSQGAGLASLGVQSGELEGRNLFELYGSHPEIPAHLRRALAGESFSYNVEAGGAVFDTWVAPLIERGEVTGIVGLSHDVTHLRRLQANAIQNDRAIVLGTLAASVAHEINNPLAFMLGHLDVLADSLARLEEAPQRTAATPVFLATMRESLDLVRAGTERIAAITRELRTFSRPSDETTRVDVKAAVTSVLKLVGKDVESRARVEVTLGDVPPVKADIARLVQVVLNLVINATQALPAGGRRTNRIWIRTVGEGEHVVIEVADNGPGVPPQDRERVFDPFLTTKDVGEGSGLGLFVCRNIISGWGGTISVDERPGGGARFRVVLSAATRSGEPVHATPSKPSAPAPHRPTGEILIIDDEPAVADVLRARLVRAGYRAVVETDAERALTRLLSGGNGIELVYCDLMMKGVSGMDLADTLAQRSPAFLRRVVFMTGGAFTPRARDFRRAYARQCIDKPFDIVAETARRLGGESTN